MPYPQRTALLLINQRSRKGRIEASRAKALLVQAGFTLLQPDEDETRSYSQLIAAYAGRIDAVIVGGGDGTLNAAAPGLMQTSLPLGILPLGTANDFARTLGIPASLEQAVKIIADGQLRAVDLGEVNQHLFLNVSSIGFSAELAHNLTAESKKKAGVWAAMPWRRCGCCDRAVRSAPRWCIGVSGRQSKRFRCRWATGASTGVA